MGGRECAVAAAVGQALLQPNASRSPFHTTSVQAGVAGQLRERGVTDLRERGGHVRALP